MPRYDHEDTPRDEDTHREKIRLYVTGDLQAGTSLSLNPDQAHYLQHVMRLGVGDGLGLFNGRDGEWRGVLESLAKGRSLVKVGERIAPQRPEPDIWYLFAPVKRARLDYMMEKAGELGAAKIIPVRTRHTMVSRVNVERLQANATEAAEQCGRLSVPVVEAEISLTKLLERWDAKRKLIFCDEGGGAAILKALGAWQGRPPVPWALLIGPEGGFDDDERRLLRSKDFVVPVSLGPRILRADSAAVAALTAWQMMLGDWGGDWGG